ncbi:TlpA family protein disulfide reductase [Rahnella aceris]|uniref:TlpA family protein disulfide reductase n=1 Tax=Rahnella sp. (strain Y9602) TaxID=2703885 RepID=UPI000F29982A|nr:thiol-disulfide isomerase/thioredoxin [Rahnella aquatilis]
MLWRKCSLMVALVAVTLLAGCKQDNVALGKEAPALAAYDLQGEQASLDRWKGKTVYLNFWSVSCGGCVSEMATLEKLSKTYGDKIVVVAVNTDAEQVDLRPVLSQRQIGYPVVRDQLGITQERYAVIGTPTSFLIDAQGKVTAVHQGARNAQALTMLFQQIALGA